MSSASPVGDRIGEARSFVRETQKKALFYGSVAGLTLVFLWSREVGFGFIAGYLISMINFQLMSVDAFDLVEKVPGKARKFIIGRYLLRYAIMFGFLALVATRTSLNIFASFAGLFFIQGVLVTGQVSRFVRGYTKR